MTNELSNNNIVKFSAAQTSRAIKSHLKKLFPHMERLSVTCKSFCIRIEYVSGPPPAEVEKIVRIFEGAEMVDNGGDKIKGYKSYVEWGGKKVDFGIDFIFVSREWYPSEYAKICKYVCDAYGFPMPEVVADYQGYGTRKSWTSVEFDRLFNEESRKLDSRDIDGLVWAPVEGTLS